jgi:hypothetical protein
LNNTEHLNRRRWRKDPLSLGFGSTLKNVVMTNAGNGLELRKTHPLDMEAFGTTNKRKAAWHIVSAMN